MTNYFLRGAACAEPLVNGWYAWPMLISPATAALVTLNSHLSILRSYVQMPKMHEAAVKNAKMRGGPFADFKGENKVEEVKRYLEAMQAKPTVELAKALIALNQLMQTTNGETLAPLYADIPDILRGYVELVYDVYHRPNFRLLEGLLYKSPLYDTSAQSFMLSLLAGDERSFVLSTPRLSCEHELAWQIPFASPAIDQLFASREQAITDTALNQFFSQHFEDNAHNRTQFFSLFSEQKPQVHANYKRYQGEGVRIRYFGHACVLIETKQTTILVDAMISYSYPTSLPRFTYDDLPEFIDYVVLTHSHQDHVMFEHLLQLRHKIGHIVVPKNASGMIQDPSLKLMFKALHFKHVIELDEMESIALPDGELLGIPFFGEHGDLYIQSKMAYVMRLQGKTLLFAADSDNIEPRLYEHLKKEIPTFDVMFLGMECDGAPVSWLYGSIMGAPLTNAMDQSRRLNGSNCERAMEIIRCFDCKEIYIYAMGQEPWLGYITSIDYTEESKPITESNQLVKTCQAEGRVAERLYLKKELVLQ